MPVNTFIATAEAVSLTGAKPVFVDVNESDGLIDPKQVESQINSNTRGIIPVHLYGNICDMEKIAKISSRRGLEIILEDCAQAHGSELNGKRVPIGKIGSFSFYPGKSLGAIGDAGCIVCDDEELATIFKNYVDHGRKNGAKYVHDDVGFNFRMDEIQAAIIKIKIPYLSSWLNRKREIASVYDQRLEGVENIKPREGVKHSYHLYVVRSHRRDELQKHLKDREISTGIHYPVPLHLQPAYANLGYKQGDFPVAEKLSKEVLSLPIYPEMTDEQVSRVIEAVNEFNLKEQ